MTIQKGRRRIAKGIAALSITAAAVFGLANPAFAAYDHPSCYVTFPGVPDCWTGPIYPHSTQNWVRYKIPTGMSAELKDQNTGGIINDHLINDNNWHTVYNLNSSHRYNLHLHVAFGGNGWGHLANCTTLPDGSPCN